MVRHTSCLRHIRIAAGLLLVGGVAGAAPVINFFPSIGPDIDVAAAFGEYSANALFAIQNGLTSYGMAGTPSYYEQTSSFNSTDLVSTYSSFNSWRGQTPPPTGYEGQYGNMLYWGVSVSGNGERFTLDNVTYTDSFFGDTFTVNMGAIGFGNRAIGINFGADGIRGTADDVILTGAASASAKIDVLYFSGIGSAFVVNDPSLMSYYLNEIRNADYPFARASYMVNTISGPTFASHQITMSDAVPEPATFGFVGLGLVAIAFAGRRWKR